MSVPKSKRSDSPVQFLETARELEAHTFKYALKMPKRYSFLLTNPLMELASAVHQYVRSANKIHPLTKRDAQLRREEFLKAQSALQGIEPKLQLLYTQLQKNPEGINIEYAMETWGSLIAKESRLITGVLKADAIRYKDLPEI